VTDDVRGRFSDNIEVVRRRTDVSGRDVAAAETVYEASVRAQQARGLERGRVHVAIGPLEGLQELTAAIVAIDGVRKTTSTFTVSTPVPYRVQPPAGRSE
jgi:hypothetical protein